MPKSTTLHFQSINLILQHPINYEIMPYHQCVAKVFNAESDIIS